MQKRILLVGAGAAGQVFGLYLERGGADVSVFVRPKHEAAARAGYRLYHVDPLGRRKAERLSPSEVHTDTDSLARAEPFEQVWLCVATTSLDPEWLSELAAATAPATLVSFQPGLGVRERLEHAAPRERIAQGVIGFLAWATPLEKSADPRELAVTDDPGIAYFTPPGMVIPISSPSERRALQVIDALRAGGMGSHLVGDAEADLAFGTALLMPVVGGLELAGWSFATFREGDAARLVTDAAKEALAVTIAETGREPPMLSRALLLPELLRLGSWVMPKVAPIDVETYLRVHFTKVGEQTRMLLAGYSERAARHGLPNEAIESMTRGLEDLPA
jgi:ketopantoate reductase